MALINPSERGEVFDIEEITTKKSMYFFQLFIQEEGGGGGDVARVSWKMLEMHVTTNT